AMTPGPAAGPASAAPLAAVAVQAQASGNAPAALPTLPAASSSASLAAPSVSALATSAGAAAAPYPSPSGETVFSAPLPSTATAVAVAPAASGLVQLRTSEASWIEARDARGHTLLSRTVLPGESVGLDGSLPIRMTIGNASATQLGFKGQAVDLTRRTRDNIARVELQ
ncbi:MAG: DUF4115 domain-containing protein, partial [Rubrivivax sp.]|nr:DUF4115 domain-containing protein [Rubrivivax sp.]